MTTDYCDPMGPITPEEQAAANAALEAARQREATEPEPDGDTITCPNCGCEDCEPIDLIPTLAGTFCNLCLDRSQVCDWCGRIVEPNALAEIYRGKHEGDQVCWVCLTRVIRAVDAVGDAVERPKL